LNRKPPAEVELPADVGKRSAHGEGAVVVVTVVEVVVVIVVVGGTINQLSEFVVLADRREVELSP